MGLLNKLTSVAVESLLLPLDAVRDIMTCGGSINYDPYDGRYEGPYTWRRIKSMADTLELAAKDLKDESE